MSCSIRKAEDGDTRVPGHVAVGGAVLTAASSLECCLVLHGMESYPAPDLVAFVCLYRGKSLCSVWVF